VVAFAAGSDMRLINRTKVSIFAKKTWTWTFDHLAQSVSQADALNQQPVPISN
jgi:hypothetical protein